MNPPAVNEAAFSWPVRVYYEDTDAGGVVYHAVYLQYLERARTEWLRAVGFGQRELARAAGVLFAVRAMELDYLRPARLDDALTVTVDVMQLKPASLTLSQCIIAATGEPLLTAVVRIACVDTCFRPTRIPSSLAKELSHAR
jgi:acyl-CoA thioester hydrolase